MTDPTTDPRAATGASNRHRPDPATPAQARGAIIALAVSAIGTVAFVVGLRAALHIAPPERRAAAPDSAASDSARGARSERVRPPERNQPDDYPRLR